MNSTRLLAPLALVLASASSLTQAQDCDQRADLSRLVVVGDSLSAGFQNGSLMRGQQEHGFANVLAGRARVGLDLPLIFEPGIPNVLELLDPGPPPVIAQAPGQSLGRVDTSLQATCLAVPGHTVRDALDTRPDFDFMDLTDFVLGFPGVFTGTSRSQVEWAEALSPTTALVWLGNNDTLGAALDGDATLVTPRAEFEAAYVELMDRMEATGATLVVANIPDVTLIPYLSSAEEVAELIGAPLELIGPLLDIGPGDYVTPDAFEQIGAILGGLLPGPLSRDVVLDAAEVAFIQQETDHFNGFIAAQAAGHGAALVNVNALLGSIADRGLHVGGRDLTVDFLGGIFSLDGFHPTNTGYAIVANAFIKRLNRSFAAGIPPVSIRRVMLEDPLVYPGFGEGSIDVVPLCSSSYLRAKPFRDLMRPRQLRR